MTTRIKLIKGDTYEQARRAELERLTGCPIHHVIDGVCREPGCQNAALQLQKELVMAEEDCLRLRDVALDEVALRQLTGLLAPSAKQPEQVDSTLFTRDGAPSYARDAAPIFQTKPCLRCVL